MVMFIVVNGIGVVIEIVFENRFMYVVEFNRMGVNIKIDGRSVVVNGVDELYGVVVNVIDLRVGVVFILCGFIVEGEI